MWWRISRLREVREMTFEEWVDFYNRKKQEYINALPEERDPYAYRSTWDRFRRGWDSH
jgi:hypothetical protein